MSLYDYLTGGRGAEGAYTLDRFEVGSLAGFTLLLADELTSLPIGAIGGVVGVAVLSAQPTPTERQHELALLLDAARHPASPRGHWGFVDPASFGLPEDGRGEFAQIDQFLRRFGPRLPPISIVTVPEPELAFGAGGDITCNAKAGRIGCSLTWAGGAGFATAGHVGQTVGAPVYASGNHIGNVVWANDPAGHGSAPEADFAVVELLPNLSISSASGYRTASAYDTVDLWPAPRGAPATVIGYARCWAMPTQSATIADAYIAAAPFTIAGDSGNAVSLVSGEVIGHVVGEATGVATLIQDLKYQVRQARAHLPGLTY